MRDLIETLPAEISRLVHPCARHRRESPHVFHREEFLRRVMDRLMLSRDEAFQLSRVVFAAVGKRVTAKEVGDVASQLPADLRDLWRSAP